ncbi:MAG: ABC transporter ATP-binding protein [Nitrospinota bacterium]
MLEANLISFNYGTGFKIDNISFRVNDCELFYIVGPNGSGKTTLLKILAGLIKSQGELRVDNSSYNNLSSKELARLISYVPQKLSFGLELIVKDYIAMGRYAYQRRFAPMSKDDKDFINQAIELTDVAEFLDRPIQTLSEGEKSKVLIAATICQNSKIILLDEPTAHLDLKSSCEILKLLVNLKNNSKKTIVVVTHDLNQAALFADRVLGIREGENRFLGSADGLIDNRVLINIYHRKFNITYHPLTNQKLVAPDSIQDIFNVALTGAKVGS